MAERKEETTSLAYFQQTKLLAKSPLAGSLVNLNERIKVLTLQLEQTTSDIAQQPEKFALRQDSLCHMLIKALHNGTDDNILGQQLQIMTVTTYLREKDNQYGFSPFHWLMLKDDTRLSDYLTTQGFKFDQRDKLGLLPTHLAAYFGKQKFLLHRLNKVPQFNEVVIEFTDTTQNPPQKLKFVLNELHLSIMGRQLEQVQAIFDIFNNKHAFINTNIKTIGNLLHLIVYVSCHESPERKSDSIVSTVELLQVVLRNFTADNIKDLLKQKEHNHENLTPLMLAAKYGQVSLLRELMTYLQVHVEQANSLQEIENAFYCAARHGQNKVVEVFLQYYRFEPNIKHAAFRETMRFLDKMKESNDPDSTLYEAIDNMINNAAQGSYFSTYQKPDAKTQAYKNLVLSGGGGKGFALPYLLQAFKQHVQYRSEQEINPLTQETLNYSALQRVAGTSAGAIFAMALAVGHSPEDIITNYYNYDFAEFLENEFTKDIVKKMDAQSPKILDILNQVLQELQINLDNTKKLAKKIISNSSGVSIALHGLWHRKELMNEIKIAINRIKELDKNFQGFSPGKNALDFIKRLLTDKGLLVGLTFGELAKLVSQNPKTYKHLHVVVTNLSKGTFEVLSSENAVYKDYVIVDAIRASMSYPIVFAPHHLSIKRNGITMSLQDEYIDGGVLRNFAIDEFDFKQYTNTQWIGDPRYPELNKETLGFRFEVDATETQAAIASSGPNDVSGRVKALISIYAEAESLINEYVDREYGRSIAIDTSPITTFTFKRFDVDKSQLKYNVDKVVAAYFGQQLPTERIQPEELSSLSSASTTIIVPQAQSMFESHISQEINSSQPFSDASENPTALSKSLNEYSQNKQPGKKVFKKRKLEYKQNISNKKHKSLNSSKDSISDESNINYSDPKEDDMTTSSVSTASTNLSSGSTELISTSQLPASSIASKIFKLPRYSNHFGESRKTKLDEIDSYFQTYNQDLTKIVIITGIKGVGKTQLACKYAHTVKSNFNSNCHWISINQESSLFFGFKEIATKLGIFEKNEVLLKQAVYKQLETLGPVLLILDGVKDFKSIKSYLPPDTIYKNNIHILITTNKRDCWDEFSVLDMKPDTEDMRADAITFLHKVLDVSTAQAKKDEEIKTLAQDLGYLMLALVQAAHYINRHKTDNPITDYLSKFKNRKKEFLDHKLPETDTYQYTVLVAFTLALEAIKNQQHSNEAEELLYVSTYLYPKIIHRKLLCSFLGKNNPILYEEAISLLNAYSLIDIEDDRKYFSIHNLLQDVIRICIESNSSFINTVIGFFTKRNPNERSKGYLLTAIKFINQIFRYQNGPLVSTTNPDEMKDIFNHAIEVIKHAERLEYETNEIITTNYKVGIYYLDFHYNSTKAQKYLNNAKVLSENLKIKGYEYTNTIRQLYKAALRTAQNSTKGLKNPKHIGNLSEYEKKTTECINNFETAKNYLNVYSCLANTETATTCCDWANFHLKDIKFSTLYTLIDKFSLSKNETIKLYAATKTLKQKTDKTLEYLNKARQIIDSTLDEKAMVAHYFGNYYIEIKKYELAIEEFKSSLKLKLEFSNFREIARTCARIGNSYWTLRSGKNNPSLLNFALKFLRAAVWFFWKNYQSFSTIDTLNSLKKIADILYIQDQLDESKKILTFLIEISDNLQISSAPYQTKLNKKKFQQLNKNKIIDTIDNRITSCQDLIQLLELDKFDASDLLNDSRISKSKITSYFERKENQNPINVLNDDPRNAVNDKKRKRHTDDKDLSSHAIDKQHFSKRFRKETALNNLQHFFVTNKETSTSLIANNAINNSTVSSPTFFQSLLNSPTSSSKKLSIIDNDYWYTAEDIDKILKLQLPDDQVEVCAGLCPFLKNTDGQAAYLFQETLRNVLVSSQIPAVIPINLIEAAALNEHGLSANLQGTHWIGFAILPLPAHQQYTHKILIIDSFGNGLDHDKDISTLNLFKILEQVDETNTQHHFWEKVSHLMGLMQGVLEEIKGRCTPQIIVTNMVQQTNSSDCGAFVVQNLVSVIKEKGKLCEQNGSQLRTFHHELLKQNLSSLNTPATRSGFTP